MSNFQKKYYYDFKSIDNKSHTVEIWQDNPLAISPYKVIGGADAFTVTLSGIENKFQPVRGTGADLNLFATSTMQFMDLYTANMMEYQVRHYIDGSLNWCGFLDSEIFSTDFSRQKNYNVAITANDGFALLERLYYVQSFGSHYTGMSSHKAILQIILNHLNLPYTNIYIGLSTSIVGVTPATSETILDKTYINNDNFYDEDGTPFTLRTVLESILMPYGAFIIQDKGNLYLTDIQSLANTTTFSCKRYTSDFTYVDAVNVNTLIGDLSTIGFASNTQSLDTIPGVNKQVIKYSPYRQIDIMDYKADEDFLTQGSTTAIMGVAGYRWTETYFLGSKVWLPYSGSFARLNGVDDPTAIDYYLVIKNDGSGSQSTVSYTYNVELPKILASTGYKLKIDMKGYFRKSNDLENPSYTPSVVRQGILYTDLRIGDKKYVNNTLGYEGQWVASTSTEWFRLFFNNEPTGEYNNIIYSPMEDNWLDAGGYVIRNYNQVNKLEYLIPLDNVSGTLTFNMRAYKAKIDYTTYTTCLDARFKDIKFTIVDKDGNDIKELDIEYVGYMNPSYVNEGDEITLQQGSNLDAFPTERGALLKYDGTSYSFITQWTRASVTDNIENLLLRSFVGNYENKTIQLTCDTRLISSMIGYISYSAYLSGKKFMLTSVTQDYANNKSQLTMQEISVDSLTINKSF